MAAGTARPAKCGGSDTPAGLRIVLSTTKPSIFYRRRRPVTRWCADVARQSGLLETPGRIGFWPDSVQVPGGARSQLGCPLVVGCGSLSVCSQPGTADEVWLQKGLPCS